MVSINLHGGSEVSVGKCSNKPNCVSSIDERSEFKVDPFKFEDPVKGINQLVEKIKKMDRVKLKSFEEGKSAHFVFKTKLMRFKDDVYLEVNKELKQVDVKSESRFGYSDWGVNKDRVEAIRKLL